MNAATSWHDRHRERLAALRGGDVVLGPSPRPARHRAPDGAWRRTFGRIELDREHYATLVLERDEPQEIVLVEVFEARPERRPDEGAVIRAPDVGWLRIVPFDRDPRLTTLSTVTAEAERSDVVRYRPYRRCTLRITDREGVRFAKVFTDGRGDSIHAAGVALWTAHRRGELPFAVPRPGAYSARTRTVWQSVAARRARGHAPLRRTGRASWRAGSAAAAAALTRSRVAPAARYDAAAQLADSHRKATELLRLVPRLAPAVDRVLDELRALHAGSGSAGRARSTGRRTRTSGCCAAIASAWSTSTASRSATPSSTPRRSWPSSTSRIGRRSRSTSSTARSCPATRTSPGRSTRRCCARTAPTSGWRRHCAPPGRCGPTATSAPTDTSRAPPSASATEVETR